MKFVRGEAAGALAGLAMFNVDPSIHARVRLNLHHVSTARREDFASALSLTMDYIWRCVYCDEVRVALTHVKNAEGKPVVDAEVRECLKNALFRWKTLTNEDGVRKLIMAAERKAAAVAFENPRAIVPQKEPLQCRGMVAIRTGSS